MKFKPFVEDRLRNKSIVLKNKKRIDCIYCMDTGKSRELDFYGKPCKRCEITKEGSQEDGNN